MKLADNLIKKPKPPPYITREQGKGNIKYNLCSHLPTSKESNLVRLCLEQLHYD